MEEKELLEKNRFAEEEYKKKVKEQELLMKKLRKKQNASLRKLKKAVQNKKDVDEFVRKLKEKENE